MAVLNAKQVIGVNQILKEPLFHFLLIGFAIFSLYALVNPGAIPDKQVVVDDGRINNIIALFEKKWHRAPSDAELQGLIDDYVLEEIYYRQALKMGMDENDAIVRRRLRQKMEFFTTSAAAMVEPEEEDLKQYLQQHADKYKADNRYSFEQVYISPDHSREELKQKLSETKQALQQGESVSGDKNLLPQTLSNAGAFEVERTFGKDFSGKLDALPMGAWSDPLQSGLGWHFIKLTQRETGEMPALSQVRDAVMRDWVYEKSQTLRKDLERKLRSEYQVVVEWPNKTSKDPTRKNL